MIDYKRILRLDAVGVSGRGIAEALGCSRNTVAAALGAAKTLNIVYEQVANLDADQVRHRLFPDHRVKEPDYAAPDFEKVHAELARPNVTLQLVWNEYASLTRVHGQVPYQYSTFTEHYRRWAQVSDARMTIARKPGEMMEVDWAGDTMVFIDPSTGELRKAYLFVAALPYSAYFYVEPFTDMTLGSWLDAHVGAFEFFGGATRLLIPDNLRTGVVKADRYEPVLNPAYAQLADHYGTAVIPARVRKPRDKAVVENMVRHGANQVMAALRDRQFIGLGELAEAVSDQVAKLNARPFQKREGSRVEVFTQQESPLLIPLPPVRFELAELRKAKVGPNYHVQVDGCFYSVPSRLIGQSLDVRITTRMIEVFDSTGRVASHARIKGHKGRYQTVEDHMPPAHRAQLKDWTPARFTNWATQIGSATCQVIEQILGSRKIVEQSYRSCLGVMALAKKQGGATRLEDTCVQALAMSPAPTYTMIKNLWAAWQPQQTPSQPSLGDAGFVRGADYYQQGDTP
ncbi:MAG: IS21 family transposase [Micrococcales bacterium]|nr:IS21 family transposase [Micrococcales bacterium]